MSQIMEVRIRHHGVPITFRVEFVDVPATRGNDEQPGEEAHIELAAVMHDGKPVEGDHYDDEIIEAIEEELA